MKVLILAVFVVLCVAQPISMRLERKSLPLKKVGPGEVRYLRNPKRALLNKALHSSTTSLLAKSKMISMYQDFPLRGNWSQLALYYLTIQIGQSNQTFEVQVDTGSSDLGVPKVGCKCGDHPNHPPWDPSRDRFAAPAPCHGTELDCSDNGADCKNGQCEYTIEYADGSGYSAQIYNDTITFGNIIHGGIRIHSQYVGAIYKEVTPNGPFEPQGVQGIMGMAQQFLSVVNAPPPIDTLSKENSNCPRIFSLCGDVYHQGGVLTVCGVGNHGTGSVQYTPMVNYEQGFYQVYTVDMSVAGQRMNIPSRYFNSQQSIVDSGTTLMLLPDKAFDKMKSVFLANCSSSNLKGVCNVPSDQTIFDNGNCFPLSLNDVNQYPHIQLIFGEKNPITVDFPPTAYVVPGFCSDPTQYSLSIAPIGGEGAIYGDPIFQAQSVTFDIKNKRMGFQTKSNCFFQ